VAKKRTKKEAKERIDSVNFIDPDNNILSDLFPRTRRLVRVADIIEEAAKAGGKVLVEFDPANRLVDEGTTRTQQAKNVITDEGTIIPIAQLADVINDPEVVMNGDGSITRGAKELFSTAREVIPSAREAIRRSGQFRRDLLLPRFSDLPKKRTRKKNGNDKKLSKAFKEANAKLRTKSGKLRKGKTQADVARLAQRLRKKMK
jgi:hypothetical protein